MQMHGGVFAHSSIFRHGEGSYRESIHTAGGLQPAISVNFTSDDFECDNREKSGRFGSLECEMNLTGS